MKRTLSHTTLGIRHIFAKSSSAQCPWSNAYAMHLTQFLPSREFVPLEVCVQLPVWKQVHNDMPLGHLYCQKNSYSCAHLFQTSLSSSLIGV